MGTSLLLVVLRAKGILGLTLVCQVVLQGMLMFYQGASQRPLAASGRDVLAR